MGTMKKIKKLKKIKAAQPLKMKQSKQPSKKPAWSKVKIAGSLVTDDGGGLEGLIGLEVLEDYDKDVITSKRRLERDDENERITSNDSKKTPAKEGRFVLLRPPAGEESKNKKKKQKNSKKTKISDYEINSEEDDDEVSEADSEIDIDEEQDEESELIDEIEAEEIADALDQEVELTTDDLIEWKTLGVPEPILRALAEKGFKEPTKIQSLTLPAAILGKKDILGAAETGSGKTLAFGIPILNGILEMKANGGNVSARKVKAVIPLPIPHDDDEATEEPVAKKLKPKKRGGHRERDNLTPPPDELRFQPIPKSNDWQQTDAENRPLYALILTPTRELCVQVKDHIVAAAKYTGINVAAIFGGLAHVKQERVLKKCPEIVVATPGRLWELIRDGNEHLNKLRDISYLVIDETDRMVEKGHFEEMKLILNQLNADDDKKAQRQNFVFSATLTLVHDLPRYVKGKKQKQAQQTAAQKIHNLIEHLGISQPKVVDITKDSGTAETLTECRIICELSQKDWYLYYFLQRHPGRTIVFCNSIDCVKRLGQLFALLGCNPRPLHAHMNQRQRLKNLERFTASDSGLLIATDVAARGLDIPKVKHVIHYQVPRTSENYVHRSGRTARANTEGITVLLMEPTEIRDYVKLCRTLKRTDDIPLFPVSERHLKAVKARVDLAREVDVLELKMRRSKSEIGWIKKTAQEMDILVDDMSDFSEADLYDSDDGGDRYRSKHELKQKRDNLSRLLAKPLFPKGFSYKYPTSTGKLDIPHMDIDENKEDAVHVMKTAIADFKQAKKRNKTMK